MTEADGKPRVVVTGLGMVTPLGKDVESSWAAALAGKSCAGLITRFDTSEYKVRIACEVNDFDPSEYMDYREVRRFDRLVQMAVAVAHQAVGHAGLVVTPDNAWRIGVLIGTGIGGLETIQAAFDALSEKGPMRVNPLTGAMMLPDMPAGQVAITFGVHGPNFAISSACATGSHAIGEAFEILRRGDADVMLAGATEAGLTPFGLSAFHRTGAMSTNNEDPEHACRPFDLMRDGFVFGEGAAMLVLETLDHALSRGAKPLVELAGYGATADAYHVSAPLEDGEGSARAMQIALAKAGGSPDEIDYINAHGTATPLNDSSETRAIKAVLGERAYRVPVSSTKSMHGHMLGAAGAVEAALTVLALISGQLPPTINYEHPDPECDLDYVPNQARDAAVPLRAAISNSMGFGGHNASLLFRRYDD
ncbi:MAG: beta-ketoacyl-ACP synthase II [Anaerolineae bacterium]